MITVNEIIRSYIQKDSRRFLSRISCDGGYVSGVIRSWTVNKGSCGGSYFQPQSIFSNFADISIDYCQASITGKKLGIEIGIEVAGVEHWFKVATVYANKPFRKGTRTTIEGLGVISAKMGKKYAGGTYTTVSSLLSHLSSVAGCSIILEDGFEDMEIPAVDLSDYYYREVLAMVCGIFNGYATENIEGNIVIKSYKTTGDTITAYPSRMASDPNFYDETEVIGIQVIGASDTEFIVGDLQNCSLTNPLMTSSAFTDYVMNYVGYKYQPFEMELTLGDFTLEPWDVISITDREGIVHNNLPCMSIKHTYDGGLRTVVSAPTLETGEDRAREETTMQSNTAYNAYVSGNFGSNEEPEKESTVKRFDISGSCITNGFGWTDNDEIYYINFDLTTPDVPDYVTGGGGTMASTSGPSYAYVSGTGQTGMSGISPLGSQFVNGVMPIFYHNGSIYTGAGALAYSVRLSFREDGSFTWTLYLQFTTTYVESNIGNLYTRNADGTYNVLSVDTTIPVRTFFLSHTVK